MIVIRCGRFFFAPVGHHGNVQYHIRHGQHGPRSAVGRLDSIGAAARHSQSTERRIPQQSVGNAEESEHRNANRKRVQPIVGSGSGPRSTAASAAAGLSAALVGSGRQQSAGRGPWRSGSVPRWRHGRWWHAFPAANAAGRRTRWRCSLRSVGPRRPERSDSAATTGPRSFSAARLR